MNIFFLGFGSLAKNGFLSLIEDTMFPFPFYQKVDKMNSANAKKMSWRRRVDVNMAFYIFILTAVTSMKLYYQTISVGTSSNFN